jgi:hypothetical protein
MLIWWMELTKLTGLIGLIKLIGMGLNFYLAADGS